MLHHQLLAKVVGLAADLDPLMQVLLKVGTVHDAILNRVGTVNEQLDLVLLPNLALALQGLLSGLLGGFCCRGHAAFYSETCLLRSQPYFSYVEEGETIFTWCTALMWWW